MRLFVPIGFFQFDKLEIVKRLLALFQRVNDYCPHYNNCKNWTELRPIHYFGSKYSAFIYLKKCQNKSMSLPTIT